MKTLEQKVAADDELQEEKKSLTLTGLEMKSKQEKHELDFNTTMLAKEEDGRNDIAGSAASQKVPSSVTISKMPLPESTDSLTIGEAKETGILAGLSDKNKKTIRIKLSQSTMTHIAPKKRWLANHREDTKCKTIKRLKKKTTFATKLRVVPSVRNLRCHRRRNGRLRSLYMNSL